MIVSIECRNEKLPAPYTGNYFADGGVTKLRMHAYLVYENQISVMNGLYSID